MDGLGKVVAIVQETLTSGGSGGDKEVQVGVNAVALVDAAEAGKAGGKDGNSTQQEHVFVLRGIGCSNDFLQEFRKMVLQAVGEGGQFLHFL